jgi:hypothetical protein
MGVGDADVQNTRTLVKDKSREMELRDIGDEDDAIPTVRSMKGINSSCVAGTDHKDDEGQPGDAQIKLLPKHDVSCLQFYLNEKKKGDLYSAYPALPGGFRRLEQSIYLGNMADRQTQ